MKAWWRRPRVAVVALVAALLLTVAGASFARRVQAYQPFVGVQWATTSRGPVAMEISPGSPAARAGVREGDILLAVDGEPIRHALDAEDLPWRVPAGERVEFTVRRDGIDTVLVASVAWTPRTEPYVYLVIVGLAFLLSGAFIAIRWPGIRGGVIYAALSAVLFVHLTLSPTGRADALDWSFGWGSDIAGAAWPALLIHLGVALSRRTMPHRRIALGVAYGISATIVGISVWISPLTLGGAYRRPDPAAAVELWVDRPIYLWMSCAVTLTIGLLAKAHARSHSVTYRSQMRWLLWGLAVGLGPFIVLYAMPWSVGAAELPEWARFLAVVPLVLVPLTFTAALARYRLHDVDVLALRVVSEVTSVLLTFAILAATIFLMRRGIGEFIPISRGATRYAGLLAAAVTYPQVRSWVRAAVERAFYKQRYSYRATLLDWARELNAETDLVSLIKSLRNRVRDTLGIQRAEVLLRTASGRFEMLADASGSEPLAFNPQLLEKLLRLSSIETVDGVEGLPWARHLFAMKVKDGLRAILAVSDRDDVRDPLTSQDRALLGTLSAHAATAIEAAHLVREVRRRADEVGRLHALQNQILESSAVGLLLLDRKREVRAWNRALEGIYGISREEAIGCELQALFPLHVARRIEVEADSAETHPFRLQMSRRDGRRCLLNIAVSAVQGVESGQNGWVVTFDDVTQRVEMEAQMLQQERLASLGMLAAGVAHEINTPLTGISSYTQLMLDDSAAPRRDLLEKIEQQTQRATGITRSLLNLARPEETLFEALDLNETVREVVQLFEPQVRRGPVDLVLELSEVPLPVRGSKGKLQQVLLNLLMNARDAVGESGKIRVSTRGGNGAAILQVIDDGVGIPEDDLPRIFDPFFTTKRRGKGTGLGLSISFGIVEEHGGRLMALSRPGEMTQFCVELPLDGPQQAMAQ